MIYCIVNLIPGMSESVFYFYLYALDFHMDIPMVRKYVLLTVVSIMFSCISAKVIRRQEMSKENINRFAGSLYEYEAPTEPHTPVPKGFKPVYLTHFGRHGSRFLDNASNYDRPYNILKEAADSGKLTAFGKDVLRRVEIIRSEADQRAGDLTPKGMQQHRDIARRMVENYPELFTNDKTIVARSTTSHRVLVSEYSALMQILRMRPKINIDYDSSNHDEPWMYTEDRAVSAHKRKINAAVQEFNQRHTHPERLMNALFNDTAFIRHYQGRDMSSTLYSSLYELASNVQSSDPGVDLYDVFTYDEWYDLFLINNMRWYSQGGFTPLTDNVVPYGHCVTLQNFIDMAEDALSGNRVSVTLRYGHEVTLMSFFSLLELNGTGYSTDDLESVADHWVAYDVAHMGGNVQWVFFRDRKGRVIVKFLLNEEEATLPESVPFFKDDKGREVSPYYNWDDVKDFYLSKIRYWEEYKASDDTPVEESSRRTFRQDINTGSN